MSPVLKALHTTHASRVAETLAHMQRHDDNDECRLFPCATLWRFGQIRDHYEGIEHVARKKFSTSVAKIQFLPLGVDGLSYAAQLVDNQKLGIALCDLSTSAQVKIRTNWLMIRHALDDETSELLYMSNVTYMRERADQGYKFLDDEDQIVLDVIVTTPSALLEEPGEMLHACFQSAILRRKRTIILGDLLRKMDPSATQNLTEIVDMYSSFFDLIVIEGNDK